MMKPVVQLINIYILHFVLATLMLVHNGEATIQSAEEPPSRPPWQRPSMLQPTFLNTTERNVLSPANKPAYLHCAIQNLGDRTVSWVRRRDLHILTVGMFTYTTDQRFLALHKQGSHEWTLKILAPTVNDSGVYECQVSTEPKISYPFTLDVTVSKARILGNPELHVKSSSNVNLTCEVSHDTSSIYWYHNGQVINYQGQERITLETQPTTSRLHITRVTSSDTGNYTCGPASAEPASVTVHVINGENRAAMQHNSAREARSARWPPLLLLPLLLLLPTLMLPR